MAEFKLGRIRFVWKDAWTTGTVYYRDDVVRFGGRVYICVIGHTAAANFFTDLDISPTKWNLVSDGQSWKGSWATSTSYVINDIVKYGATLYICSTVHTSTSSASSGLEADISNWEVFGSGLDWKGNWSTATRYKANDLVRYGGQTYVCNTAHTSNASASSGLEVDQAKWDSFNPGIEYKTDWATSVRYKVNDVVKYGGGLYIATAHHTSSTFASDSANWSEFVEGIQFENAWAPGGIYQKGDIVQWGGWQYIALRQNTDVKCTSSTADWQVFSKGMNFRGVWGDDSSSQDYLTGDVVTVGGHTYMAKADSNNKEPGYAGDWATYWDRLNHGFKWRGHWMDDAYYVIGDVIRFGSNSYVCVKSHVSEGDDYSTETRTGAGGGAQNSKPDLDTSGTYWNILVVGSETSVLTTTGDLVYYGGAGPTRLPIGTDGQVLRVSSSGVPEWTYYGQNPDVYYVSPSGVDSPAPVRGTTLEAPFKTIRFACMQIENGAKFPEAKKLLELNRIWLQREIVEWVEYQVANTIAPFTGSFKYLQTKCERDMGYIVDAIIYDLCHGGNVKSRESALEYTDNASNFYLLGQKEETVAAINYGLTLMGNVLAQTDPAVSYQTTNGDNSTAIVTQYKATGLKAEGTTASLGIDANIKIITDAITAGVNTNVPARIELNTLVRVATGSYKEVLPIRVPALCCVMGDELRAVTVNPMQDEADLTSRTDAKWSLKAIDRLTGVVGHVVSGTGVTGSKATMTNAQDQSWPIGSHKEKSSAELLGRVVKRNIDKGINEMVEAIYTPAYDMSTPAKGYARDNLLLNKLFLQEEIISYISANYTTIKYSKTKCRRDVCYIIEALAYDLTYGGNWQTQNAGLAYWSGTNVLSQNLTEKTATLGAYGYLKTILQTVGQNFTLSPVLNSIYTQKTGAQNSTAGVASTIATLMQGIIDIIDNGKDAASITYPDISGVNSALVDASNQLKAATTEIAEDAIDFVSENFGTYRHKSFYCRRDIRKIAGDLKYDVAMGTNFNAVYTGIAYKRGNAQYTQDTQKTQTIAGINKARDLLKISVTNDGSSATGSSNASARITTAFDEVTNIIELGTLSNTKPGDGVADALVMPSPAGVPQDRVDAKNLLQGNKAFIVADVNAWVANNHPSHSHSVAKCTRDTEYLIDALSYDVLYGGNQAASRIADSFIDDDLVLTYGVDGSGTSVVRGAYTHMKSIVDDIVQEVSVTAQTGNSESQVTYGAAASATEAASIQAGVDLSIDVLTLRTPSGATYNPFTGDMVVTIGAHNLEVGGEVRIADNAIRFTCAMDGGATNHDYPRSGDPAHKKRLRITAETATTITVNVGQSQNTSAHSFVSGVADSILVLQAKAISYPAITWADSEYQTAFANIESDLEETIRGVVQFIATTYQKLDYNHAKCTRDLGYIIDAARYDWMLGTNMASMFAAYAYLRETASRKTIGSQKDFSLAALEFERIQARKKVNFNATAMSGINYTWNWMNDIIFGAGNEANNKQSSELNNHTASRMLELNKEFLVEEATSYVDAHFKSVVQGTNVTSSQIFVGRNFTPTAATYNATTGLMTLTIGGHGLTTSDHVKIKKDSIIFTCSFDGHASQHPYPRISDMAHDTVLRIKSTTSTTITVDVGPSPEGQRYTHTFVSAANNSVQTQNATWLEQHLPIKFVNEADSSASVSDLGLVAGTTYYVKEIVNDNEFTISETPGGSKKTVLESDSNCIVQPIYDHQFSTACARDVREIVNGMKWDFVYPKDYTRDYTCSFSDNVSLVYPANYRSKFGARYYINAVIGSREEDMYYLRNATGLRLQSLKNLNGDLLPENAYGTSRVSAGAYASLDPGWGPDDQRVWITERSPYVQNVTTFGNAAIGQKIDGALHNGGNDSIVSNDFTQVISDGIGAWITNNGRAELVSVFTYYAHIGYLAEAGGRIRATNGNNSYGDFGSVAEGVDNTETPVTAIVDNKFQFKATISKVETDGNQPITVEFDHAGNEYTESEIGIFGSGNSAKTEADEFRDNAVNRIRILDLDDSSGDLGGKGYVVATNTAQTGTTTAITIAATDGRSDSAYVGMRIVITGGQGVGQYAKISSYNSGAKLAAVVKNDGTSGWEHLNPGTTIVAPNATSVYLIEPCVEFTAPPHSSTAQVLGANRNTTDMEYCETAAIYTNITGVETSIAGSGSRFTVYRNTSKYVVTVQNGGTGYARGDTIVVAGTNLGGTSTANDLTLTVTSINSTTGAITVVDTDGIGLSGAFLEVANASADVRKSTDFGVNWTSATLPGTAPSGSVKLCTGILNDGSSTERTSATVVVGQKSANAKQVWYSADNTTWTNANDLPGGPYNSEPHICFGKNKFFLIFEGSRHVFESGDGGATWVQNNNALATTGYTGIAYGAERVVAVRGGTTTAAYAAFNNADTWTTTTLPGTSAWVGVAHGNNRFVCIASDDNKAAYSMDRGETWIDSTAPSVDGSSIVQYTHIKYAQGLFMAVGPGNASDLEAYNSVSVSVDGLNWETRTAVADPDGAITGYQAVCFGNPNQVGYWLVKGNGATEQHLARIQTGVTALGRAGVASEKVFEVRLIEPGCGYVSGAPTMTITDPNNIFDVQTTVRLGKGVLGNPTFTNRGAGYEAASAELSSTGNNGHADFFQKGTFVAVRRLTQKPTPGSNIVFDSLPNKVFKLVNTVTFLGTAEGSYTTFLNVSPNMEPADSPPHGDPTTMRIRYSQVRLTGHDFLDIGTGGFTQTNYPGTPLVAADPTKETNQNNGGRVFFTSTDQDGNFRVGDLFNVEQATGVATLNADAFNIAGLQELTLGEVTLGGNSAAVSEFSTDPFMTANSDSVVPTQRAVKAYIEAQIGGGGASLNVNTVTAGDIFIGTNQITTVTGTTININATLNFKGGVVGLPLAINYMLR